MPLAPDTVQKSLYLCYASVGTKPAPLATQSFYVTTQGSYSLFSPCKRIYWAWIILGVRGETCCETPPESISQGGSQWKGKSRHSKEMCVQWEGGEATQGMFQLEHCSDFSPTLVKLNAAASDTAVCRTGSSVRALLQIYIYIYIFLQDLRLLCFRSTN